MRIVPQECLPNPLPWENGRRAYSFSGGVFVCTSWPIVYLTVLITHLVRAKRVANLHSRLNLGTPFKTPFKLGAAGDYFIENLKPEIHTVRPKIPGFFLCLPLRSAHSW